MPDIPTVLGWIGMVLVLFAYVRRDHLRRTPYAVLNLVGAVLICIVCFAQKVWPPFVLNCIWALFAVRDLVTAKPAAASGQP